MHSAEKLQKNHDESRLSRYLRWLAGTTFAGLLGLLLILVAIFHTVVGGEAVIRHGQEVRLAIERTMHALSMAETTQRRYLITGDETALILFSEARERAIATVRDLGHLVASPPDQVERAAKLRVHVEQRIRRLEETIAIKRAGNDAEAARRVGQGSGRLLMAEARTLSGEMQSVEDALLDQRQTLAERLEMGFVAAATVLAIGLAAILAAILRQAVRASELERLVRRDLASALDERTALLREINHRVGNSLMMASTLIDMQVRASANPEMTEALKRAHSRIVAIGQVHRRLQKTGAILSLDIADYLDALCRDLGQSLAADTRHIEVSSERLELPVKTIVPLGLIVSELVTNAIRHGYGGGNGGKVAVRFERCGATLTLCVQDWGRGGGEALALPAGGGLGMTVVKALTGQLDGTFSIRSNGGTIACLTLPAPA